MSPRVLDLPNATNEDAQIGRGDAARVVAFYKGLIEGHVPPMLAMNLADTYVRGLFGVATPEE